ncbi:permease component of ribose/xylose/arabinose/galactoside ABC-type transporters [Sphaerochaeta pleomorpha str. Grapes]|uniref:Permease component of ribose/xylose/arabinose/galactoside ABC-type transporters n=1 Tax=Sphaerochaeta pleomorpha (strain ATCC BAA-1885 / DSM 22778 / Grapes) TaxID=158190 RepID=G8QRA2_SPHPG|nr:ABC transporter permease [Sphaerochaeta pleomorpha]AEV28755.1 permease component of ribose/xylose/arabinose/galactoside ABC-type transporters [Sphaerochaeta pleomorpha str. Grapes]
MKALALNGKLGKASWRNLTTNYSHWLSFILLMIVAVIVSPSFLSWNNITNQFVQGAVVGICAMGMSLIISSGMIDLSVGSSVALISALGVNVLNSQHSLLLCLVFCLVAGMLVGLINGLLVTKGRIAPFIVTLATMSAWRSVINQLGQGGPFTVDKTMYASFRNIAAGRTLGIPNLMLFLIIVTVVTALLMSKTKFGTYVYAVGSNQQAARLSGIHVDRVKTLIFTYAGTLYGLAAFLLASRLTSIQAASAGSGYEMDAIAAVAIGGTSMEGGRGKIIGTFLGVLMLRIINTVLIMANVPPFLNGLVTGVIIIVAVLAQSSKKGK